MVVYLDSLPSMHLTGGDLGEIEKVVCKDSTNSDFTFTFEKDGFEYTLDSTRDFVEEPDLPNKATEYKMDMRCKEGRIIFDANNTFSGGNLRITGQKDWVHKKKRQITGITQSNKNSLRTHSSNIIGGLYAVEILAWLVLSFSSIGSNGEVSVSTIDAILAVGVFVVAIGWPYATMPAVQYLYPYHLIKKDKSVRHRPKINGLGKYLFIILSLIGGIGGLVTVIRFIL
jgi:hypothetical protein